MAHTMHSGHILDLLRKKHETDILVDECTVAKYGPNAGKRLDAWVLRTTWSPLAMIGYEVKVSRQDFLGDHKSHAYLPYCNEFWWVMPRGVAAPEEIPEGHGLMYVTKTGNRFYTKIKAKRREIEVPGELLVGAMMNRAKIIEPFHSGRRGRDNEPMDRVQFWRDWLEERKASKSLGYKIRGRVAEICDGLQRRNEHLEQKLRRWGGFRSKLVEHGIDPENQWAYHGERKIDQLAGVVTGNDLLRVEQLGKKLVDTARSVREELHGKKG